MGLVADAFELLKPYGWDHHYYEVPTDWIDDWYHGRIATRELQQRIQVLPLKPPLGVVLGLLDA